MPENRQQNLNFGKWRNRLWPIHGHELTVFLPLFILKFCVSFNYTILTATKDTVVVTAVGGGAEVIPILKGGVVLLIACLAMLLYSKLSNKLSRTQVFYAILIPFAVFFVLYGLVLFPYQDVLTPDKSANWLLTIVGDSHKHWIAVYRNWVNSLFFVLAELWGGMFIGVLFWGFANQITKVKDAARFYALYTAGGQIGTMSAGFIVYHYAKAGVNNFTATITILMSIALLVCGVIAVVYWWTNRYVVNQFTVTAAALDQRYVQKRTKLSLTDSLIFIFRSPYLGLIAMMVIGYGLSVNLVEVSWKAMLKLQFPNAADYQAYMGIVQTILGAISLFVAIFVGGNIIRIYGWYASAQLTPIVLGVTSLLFFITYFIFPNYLNQTMLGQLQLPWLTINFANFSWQFGVKTWLFTPLTLLVFFGTIHNIACKTMKYCLFDTTKEMAYIPLGQEAKIKGKAAVDLVGARFGKSSASWIQLALIDFVGAGSILEVLPLLFPCVCCIVIFWLIAVKGLDKRFTKLQADNSVDNKPVFAV